MCPVDWLIPHQAHVSVVTDPRTISIVGPSCVLVELEAFALENLEVTVQWLDVHGKVHNPENKDLAEELASLCLENTLLTLGPLTSASMHVRSNRTAELISHEALAPELVRTILSSKCEWFKLLSSVALRLKNLRLKTHSYVSFGTGDCLSQSAFSPCGLRMNKDPRSRQRIPCGETKSRQVVGQSREEPIAIVGVSCRLPGANDLDQLWSLVSEGIDRHEELPCDRFDLKRGFRASQDEHFETSRGYYANLLDDPSKFDHRFFHISAREMAHMDPQQRVLLELAYEAMEASGYTRNHERSAGDNVGCFVGASFTEYLDNTNSHAPTAYTSTGTIKGFLCGRISHYFGWTGPAEVIDTACSSSLVAINRAFKAVQSGECSMALAGGVNIIAGQNNFLDLAKAGFLSPTGQCKPFDESADGYCRAEGGALVVLKPLKAAEMDCDNILAVLHGSATNQGGLSCGLTVPDSATQIRLYEQVLQQAGLSAHDITYIEAHGTGTQVGDPLEIASIRTVFGSSQRPVRLAIGSIKGNIGHCETAAGVAGLVKTIAMLQKQIIPPQANFVSLHGSILPLEPDRIEINTQLRDWDSPQLAAMVNSYGAAGSNAALICGSAPSLRCDSRIRGKDASWPIIISAASQSSLQKYSRALSLYLKKAGPQLRIDDIAYTLSERRQRFPYRISFQAESTKHLLQVLTNGVDLSPKAKEAKPTVLVFGGQSSMTPNASRIVYEQFAVLRTHLDMCDAILRQLGFPSILPVLFQQDDVTDPVKLHTSFVSLQYAYAMTWIAAGLKVATIVGHSLGELTALAVSGVLSLQDCLHLVATRARLMVTRWKSDRGAMLAVFTQRHELEELLRRSSGQDNSMGLDIACHNSDRGYVVSGSSVAISNLEDYLRSRAPGVRSKRVPTSHGFHSYLVEPILDELTKFSESLQWNEATTPIEICAENAILSTLNYSPSQHARNPVYFAATLQRVEERLGSCVWLEAGSGTPIIPMTKRVLGDTRSHTFLAIPGGENEHALDKLAQTVTELWRHAVDVRHWKYLHSDRQARHVWLPPYQFDRAVAWLDNIDHAAELHREVQTLRQQELPCVVESPRPPKMVELLTMTSCRSEARFSIRTDETRFAHVMSGHCIRYKPICPASLYLECVALAVQSVGWKLQKQHLTFEDFHIDTPLLPGAQNVEISMLEKHSQRSWNFQIYSRNNIHTDAPVIHATGRVTISTESKNDATMRIAVQRTVDISKSEDTERLSTKYAYSLFSRVVNYHEHFEGIRTITISGHEAVASIEFSDDKMDPGNSTTVRFCDAIVLDAFTQVLGLLINTSSVVKDNEVMVCSGAENITAYETIDLSSCRSWKVYATFAVTSSSSALGDIFAFTKDGSLVAKFSGCSFHKMAISRLESLLDPSQQPWSPSRSSTVARRQAVPGNPQEIPIAREEVVPMLKKRTPTGIRDLLAEYTGVAVAEMRADMALVDIDLDSIAAIELAYELRTKYNAKIDPVAILSATIGDLECLAVTDCSAQDRGRAIPPETTDIDTTDDMVGTNTPGTEIDSVDRLSFDSLRRHEKVLPCARLSGSAVLGSCAAAFEDLAWKTNYQSYWSLVAPHQDQIVLAYVFEAFKDLGVNVMAYRQGEAIGDIRNHPRHDKLVQRLWQILEKHDYVAYSGSTRVRGNKSIKPPAASQALQSFASKHPSFATEAQLIALSGPELANCLRGSEDAVNLFFGTHSSMAKFEEYYAESPMLACMTEMLVEFVLQYISSARDDSDGHPWRILEVGAGTGGTTKTLLRRLEDSGVEVQYTFSDVSGTMISKAKQRLPSYKGLSFEKLDLEQAVSTTRLSQYDIVIGANCAHATKDKVATTSRIRQMLKGGGIMVLSEVMRMIDWYDIVFGLLEGWWLAENGSYPLQPVGEWQKVLSQAGFALVDWSGGDSEESNTQRLLIGHNS